MKAVPKLALAALASLTSVVVFAQEKVPEIGNRTVYPQAGSWVRTTNISATPSGVPLLLTDGTVMIQNPNTAVWQRLTPDINGSYVNGTWSAMPNMINAHSPLYYASAVLKDGRVVVCGGEYNGGGAVWINKCAIFNPVSNAWTSFAPPGGWAQIGDAQCVVLPDGTFMIANILNAQMAKLNATALTWTVLPGTGKTAGDRHDEEGWTLLPDGTVLTCEAIAAPQTQKYVPSIDQWINTGSTPNSLEDPGSQEVGPAVLMPNGKVFCMGATSFTAVYTPGGLMNPGSWVSGPTFSGGLDIADGPAVLLPNGNVLCYASPGIFNSPSYFYEFDGTTLGVVPNVPNSTGNPSYVGNLMMLPSGQALFTDFSNDVRIYTPSGTYNPAWAPTITSCPTTLQQGLSFTLSGTQLNGLSQCSGYGDDAATSTNYPLVRITNLGTGHVKYARTHDHSTMAVATGAAVVSTQVDVNSATEIGPSVLQVVTNGIPSTGYSVNVVAPNTYLPASYAIIRGNYLAGAIKDLFYSDNSYLTIQNGFTASASEAPVQLQVKSTSPVVSPTSFKFTVEASATTAGLNQIISLWNYSTLAYEVLDTRAATTADQTVTVTAAGSLSRFVDPSTKEVRALIAFKKAGFTATASWSGKFDVTNWIIQ